MAENQEQDEAAGSGAMPAGPFLRDYPPTGGLPSPSPRRALVVFYRNGGHSVITVSGTRHVGKRGLSRPYSVCEIAQGTHVSALRLELPAAGGTSFFKAEVDIEWEVTDPRLAAVQVVTDVAARLTSPVLERLREVTLTYPVTDAERANRAITRECAGGRWNDLGAELGLRVRLYVRLGVDDEAIGYAKREREVRADAEITRVRQEEFRRMLLGGELEQLSFMLAADPEGAKDFLEKIRQEGREDEKERVDRLYDMALRGELHSVDVETQLLNLLNQDRRRPLQGPIGTMPPHRHQEPRQLEPSAEGPFTPAWVSDEPPRREPYRRDFGPAERRRPAGAGAPGSRPHHGSHRPDPYPADDPDRDAPPARGRTYRPDGYPVDDPDAGEQPPRHARPYRTEPHRSDPYPADDPDWNDPDWNDPDRDGPDRDDPDWDGPSRGPAYPAEPYPADESGLAPPRGRRRPRDEGWSWAEEE
ncbi:hypothetical protein ACFOOM_24505 [Streptomyces echinoruber]|uniref:PE-PGRS family protein n=1 Tax=Streptomyces echinoruber TaxID=68898 RepID=A0A918R9G1_9ACTN|nr:hypothetical protein [Streptomyces echinoruber]GGZ87254.1 hypothetical protein GCM10010389_27010 [Streptomyces echinoruber]